MLKLNVNGTLWWFLGAVTRSSLLTIPPASAKRLMSAQLHYHTQMTPLYSFHQLTYKWSRELVIWEAFLAVLRICDILVRSRSGSGSCYFRQ
jgi:hypothetical protein